MTKQNNLKMTFHVLLLGVLIMFFIPVQSELKAYNFSIQDSAKQGKMSNMDHGKMSGMKSDMQKMHKQMMSTKMTGDPDYDFASMMIKHHQGAVNMSKKEVSKGKDQEVKSMAQKVIDDQNKEIKELQTFVKKNKPSKSKMNQDKDMTGSTEKNMADKSMMDKMNDTDKKMQNMEMSGDQDKDYVSMMIMHHQQAVDMSKEYLDNGKDENLKKMAQKMIDENKDQIDKLKDWQSNHK